MGDKKNIRSRKQHVSAYGFCSANPEEEEEAAEPLFAKVVQP